MHLRNSPFSKMIEPAKELKLTSSSENFNNAIFKNPGSTLLRASGCMKDDDALRVDGDASIIGRIDGTIQMQSIPAPPKCDMSIPSLGDVSKQWVKNLGRFQSIKEEQIKFEMAAVERVISCLSFLIEISNFLFFMKMSASSIIDESDMQLKF